MLHFITTKPDSRHGPSIRNPRVYDALRRQGMSKAQAAAISNAQLRKRKKALPVVLKAPNYGARAGQTIAGRLVRGADGKFSGGGTAAPAKPPKGGRKPKKTDAQRAAERETARQERQAERQQERIATRDAVLADLGIDPGASEALVMLAGGEQPEPSAIARMGAVEAGLVEQARDGSYRMTPAGRQLLNAAARGDKGAAGDVISRARDRRAAQAEAAKPPKAAGGGGGKKPKPDKVKLPARQTSQSSKPVGGSGGGSAARQQPERETRPATDPALASLAQRLSAGEQLTDDEQQTLIRNGLARLVKGELVLTQAGTRATRMKAHGFTVYKDASGRYRWVAYSSNAYRDRDEEIVSTKALTEDCARADADGQYGPLRWWHVPGWELGQADFNAMHGRVLVESGTFKSAAIGAAVAQAAPDLQLSIGFTHAPDEPDRAGVFHHIRRFERSLVPSGRAANPFTRLIVKERHMDNEKEAALKSVLGDEVAAQVLSGAEAVQKDADDKRTAYKEADPWAAVTQALKAAVVEMIAPQAQAEAESPAEPVAEKAPPPVAEEAVEEEVIEEQAMEPMDEGGGEMSADEFLAQIGALIDAKLAPIAGLLDIEKKVASHVASLMQPFQAQQATKDDETAQLKAALKEAQDRLAVLEGDIPPAFVAIGGFRPSQARETVITKEAAPQFSMPPSPEDDTDPFAEIRQKLLGTPNGHSA